MAYVSQSEQDQIIPAPVTASPTTGGQGVAGASKAANTPGQNQPQQPSAQLSAYLNANQPQAAGLASTVAGQLGSQVSNAQNAINPAVNVYTGQLYTAPTDTATNQIVSTAPSTLTPDQTQSFQTELGGAAAAPNSANTFETTQPYQGLTSEIQNAVQTANLWNAGNNPASLSTALQPYESPGATQGDTTLDALLLSQSAPAYQQIEAAAAPAANLQGNLATATTSADQALQNAIATDNATTAAANAAPQTYATNLTNYLTSGSQNALSSDTAQNAQILADLQNNTPTQSDLTALGVTADQWAQLSTDITSAAGVNMPVTLSNYLTQTAPTAAAISPQTYASPTQYADVAALQNILGANAPVETINSSTANEAGTAPTEASLNQFNGFNADEQAQFNTTIAPIVNAIKATEATANAANSNYASGNTGGVSPGDFNNYINSENGIIASLNAQLQDAMTNFKNSTPTYPEINPSTTVTPGVGALGNWDPTQSIDNTVLNGISGGFQGIGNAISSAAGDIGSFFGFAEGGEVPKPKNLKEYLAGAK